MARKCERVKRRKRALAQEKKIEGEIKNASERAERERKKVVVVSGNSVLQCVM